ncbi:MAG: PQQ-binding-like beta-propeller repeat protein [Planctomycetales bacterium]
MISIRARWFLLAIWVGLRASSLLADDHYWPHWRGPLGTGVAPTGNPPVVWDDRDGKNIRWKTPLPGLGHSTPIIWKDRIFLTSAVPFGPPLKPRISKAPGAHDNLPVTSRQRFVVIALDRQDGEVLWQFQAHEALPHEGHHETASFASNSAVTDGERVFAFFGSHGLYCLDWNGKELWRADLGKMQPLHGHGEASSPVLGDGLVVVNWDHEGESFVVALDQETGRERWRVPRDEVTSWASPIIVEHEGRRQVIVTGTKRVRGYDLTDGTVLWECGGMSSNIVASPVYSGGMLFTGSSYEKRILLALRLEGARGDITGTRHVAWTRQRGTPYVPSPLLYDEALYFLGHYQPVLSRVDVRTGEDRPSPMRLQGLDDIYASPVAAAGRVYVTDRFGTTLVLRHADAPEVLATNRLDDHFSASGAIVGDELFLRGHKALYCLAEPSPRAASDAD